MKPKARFVGILLSIIFVFISHAQQGDFPVLKGPYLGQKPPGETPQMFAPHIISLKQSVHSSPIFSPDGREVYWCVLGEGEQPICIKIMKQVNGKWSPPAKAPFTSGVDDSNPFFSSDGNRLIYKSYRDNQNALWIVKRQGDSWGEPSLLGRPFISPYLAWQASITIDGTIYFAMAKRRVGSHDIYKSRWDGKKYLEPDKVESKINSDIDEMQPFIALDESYLIFTRYFSRERTTRLFISYRQSDGSWTGAISMGDEINKVNAAWPWVSPDGKYFFFVSSCNNTDYHYDVYWVDARIIGIFRPEEKQ